jgi:hypothetical protein
MASVKQSWIKRYGEEEGLRRWEIQKKKYGKTKSQLEQIHGKAYVDKLSEKKKTFSLEACVLKYGEIEGNIRWEQRLNKKLNTQRENFKDKKWNNGRTLEEYQKRYGVADGYNKWVKRNNHHSYMVSTQRYVDEYGDIGYDIIRGIKDNTSLSAFQQKYGDKIGSLKYDEYVQLCKDVSKRGLKYWVNYHNGDVKLAKKSLADYQNNTSIDKFIERYGIEVGTFKYMEWVEQVTQQGFKGYSNKSQLLFWQLFNELNLSKYDTYFYELNKEQSFYFNDKLIKVDFKYKNKIIEFNGDYWHANPSKFVKSDMIHETLAYDIWERDAQRLEYLKNANYNVLVVWESDWDNYSDKIINECKNFLLYE